MQGTTSEDSSTRNEPTRAEVSIVGGGVIGCGVVYFLAADRGVLATVIERERIGSQASGGAAGELAPFWAGCPCAERGAFLA